jgi:PII-like signaling protein
MHEEHFFEMAGDLPVTVEFFADGAAIDTLLSLLQAENISLFCIKLPAEGRVTA